MSKKELSKKQLKQVQGGLPIGETFYFDKMTSASPFIDKCKARLEAFRLNFPNASEASMKQQEKTIFDEEYNKLSPQEKALLGEITFNDIWFKPAD